MRNLKDYGDSSRSVPEEERFSRPMPSGSRGHGPLPDPRTDQRNLIEALVRLGMMVLHSLMAVGSFLWFFVRGLLRLLKYMLHQCRRFFRMLWQNLRYTYAEYNRPAQELLRDVKHARKRDSHTFRRELGRFVGTYLLGERGVLRTGFNYVLPVLAVGFLVAIIRYGSGLNYALSVTVNGEEIGIIASESEFEKAEDEVRQRISMAGEDADITFHPVYTLRIVSAGDSYIPTSSIADKLLAGTHTDLEEAYGVYVDGEFIGAVTDRSPISEYMSDALNNYAVSLKDNATNIYYTKEITYQEGIFLAASLSTPEELISILSSETREEHTYQVAENDSPALIAAMYGITEEELNEMNPQLETRFRKGMFVKVPVVSRYIPIAYTKKMTVTGYIDYSSVKVETSSLNLGVEKVLSKGVKGERRSEVEVTYVDGEEQSREVLSTFVTKEPIPEQIGVGTYSAQPASTSTVLTGSGKYGWPVNGGYISDVFISNRNHKGLDIAAPGGTEIYAAEAGTVYRAGWNSGGYGNYVIIDHPDGYRTLYAHASKVVCYEGQEVEKGQLIAYVGSTGDSTGNHCHFEVRVNNIPTNPADYLRVNAD